MELSADGQALMMLCSHLGLPTDPQATPLTLKEWNPLSRMLADSPLKSPAGLLDASAETIEQDLAVDCDLAERMSSLLQRSAAIAIEIERLESLGIWAVTRLDDSYPPRLKERLRESSPPVLFGAGPRELAERPGLAVVGSRNVDDAGQECARAVGEACAACRLTVCSGGARGTDAIAMHAALETGGTAVGFLADSLERTIRTPQIRSWLSDERLALMTPYSPKAGFSVGAAMGRNKLIYAIADYALVVASDAETGGTWAGATESLRNQWSPVFVRAGEDLPEGNRMLLSRGGIPFPGPLPCHPTELREWLDEQSAKTVTQRSLFA